MMLVRVSQLEAFRRWQVNEEAEVADLVAYMTEGLDPSPAMLAGTAFHKALEDAQPGEFATLTALGHTFHLTGGEVALPEIRETRAFKTYGGLTVTGQADCIHGRVVTDHKTTARFDAEGYIGGCQWRMYLDLFDADEFRWNVFELKEVGPLEFEVAPPHVLTCHRYPEMEADCARLAGEFHAFARAHLPADWQGLREAP